MVENELPAQSIAVIPRSARSGATLAPSLSKIEALRLRHELFETLREWQGTWEV